MSIPVEIKSTIEWLIKIDENSQARELVLTVAKHLSNQEPEALDFIAMILYRTKSYVDALPFAQKLVSLLPGQIEANYNLARCLNAVGETTLAEEKMKWISEQRPDWLDPHLDRALYVCLQGRFDEAESLLLDLQKRTSLADPHHDIIRFNLAWHKLRRGQFKSGMEDLTIGRRIGTFGRPANEGLTPQLRKGMSVRGKKILLVGEAGAGDEIINVRFAKIIQERGGEVFWSSNQSLETLFSRVNGVTRAVAASDVQRLQCDYWAPAMDLVSILDLDLGDVPSRAYLSADPDHIHKWKKIIQPGSQLKVGLRWQGNPLYEQDLFRSVRFDLYRKFLSIPGLEFYSLQRDTGTEELRPFDPVPDLSNELQTWEDTAAAISLLDVVVTSCTSIAHLAGALGKKTLLFTPMVAYYIWIYPGKQSPWYPDVKLFRQQKFRDWSSEAEAVFEELRIIAK